MGKGKGGGRGGGGGGGREREGGVEGEGGEEREGRGGGGGERRRRERERGEERGEGTLGNEETMAGVVAFVFQYVFSSSVFYSTKHSQHVISFCFFVVAQNPKPLEQK